MKFARIAMIAAAGVAIAATGLLLASHAAGGLPAAETLRRDHVDASRLANDRLKRIPVNAPKT